MYFVPLPLAANPWSHAGVVGELCLELGVVLVDAREHTPADGAVVALHRLRVDDWHVVKDVYTIHFDDTMLAH